MAYNHDCYIYKSQTEPNTEFTLRTLWKWLGSSLRNDLILLLKKTSLKKKLPCPESQGT